MHLHLPCSNGQALIAPVIGGPAGFGTLLGVVQAGPLRRTTAAPMSDGTIWHSATDEGANSLGYRSLHRIGDGEYAPD